MNNYTIRKMTRDDCSAVAHVISTSWKETYRGIIPEEELNRTDEQTIAENSRKNFPEDNHQFVLEADGVIAGYMNVGLTDEKEYERCGEIHAVYLLKEFKGKGFGRKMVEAGIAELKAMGCDKMVIGCLAGNPSNSFYEHIGGKLIKTRIYERLQLPENVYFFERI